jgi:hypothetical protein
LIVIGGTWVGNLRELIIVEAFDRIPHVGGASVSGYVQDKSGFEGSCVSSDGPSFVSGRIVSLAIRTHTVLMQKNNAGKTTK